MKFSIIGKIIDKNLFDDSNNKLFLGVKITRSHFHNNSHYTFCDGVDEFPKKTMPQAHYKINTANLNIYE